SPCATSRGGTPRPWRFAARSHPVSEPTRGSRRPRRCGAAPHRSRLLRTVAGPATVPAGGANCRRDQHGTVGHYVATSTNTSFPQTVSRHAALTRSLAAIHALRHPDFH